MISISDQVYVGLPGEAGLECPVHAQLVVVRLVSGVLCVGLNKVHTVQPVSVKFTFKNCSRRFIGRLFIVTSIRKILSSD